MTRKRDGKKGQNAAPRMLDTLGGWPETQEVRGEDGALRFIHIKADVQTAEGAKRADKRALQSVVLLSFGLPVLTGLLGFPFYVWLLAMLAPYFFFGVLHRHFYRRYKKTTELAFGVDKVLIRTPEAEGEVVGINRHDITTFRVDLHDDAEEEAEEHKLADARARRPMKRQKYYQKTYNLVATVDGPYPWELMEVYGKTQAEELLARVQQVNMRMDRIMAMGELNGDRAASEWDDMAGVIPEKV